MTEKAEPSAFDEKHPREAWIPHVVPFVGWLFFMQMLGDPAGWKYALRSVICLGLFIYMKPWQWYARLNLKNVPAAILAGVAVFFIWIFFETDFMSRFGMVHQGYLMVGTQPPWKLSQPLVEMYYAPETCGWAFAMTRLLGSAFVISFIEEFFWRGWMYRWALAENFLKVDLGKFDKVMFFAVAMLFGLIHHRWLVGFLCGIIYGILIIRTKDIWAGGIAHAVTNLLLGIYVIWAEKYEFWS